MELILLFTLAFTFPGIFTAFAAIIHTVRFATTPCTLGTMVHFVVTTWGISGSERKRCNGKQHQYIDEKKTSHDF
jgi:hypothetical protein